MRALQHKWSYLWHDHAYESAVFMTGMDLLFLGLHLIAEISE